MLIAVDVESDALNYKVAHYGNETVTFHEQSKALDIIFEKTGCKVSYLNK